MTVAERRQAAGTLRGGGLSQRKACQLAGVGRSSCRYEAVSRPERETLRRRLRKLAHQYPRYGYRRVAALLRREGLQINHKRVYRLWREEGLILPRKRPKRRRKGPMGEIRQKPRRVNHVWSYDFAHDGLIGGRAVKILAVVDDFSRRCLALEVAASIRGWQVQEVLQGLFRRHGRPEHIRSDNGPEFVSREVCEWLEEQGTRTAFITPGSPWENAYVESFIGKLRDECLSREWFVSLEECRQVVESWRREYNEFRPHSSLGYRTPAEAADFSGGLTPLRSANPPAKTTRNWRD